MKYSLNNKIGLLLGALFLMTSCSLKQNVVRYTIASESVDCSGVGMQKCLLVKKADSTDWEYFYSRIEGFNYERGFEYVLDVKEENVGNVPADASSIKYVLIKQISKTEKRSENMPVPLTENSHTIYQWGGKVLEIDNITVGRGAAEGNFPVSVLKIEVSHSSTDLFNPGDVIYAELIVSPQAKPVVGREYVFKAKDMHPAHTKGIYMLDTDVLDLVV